MLRSPRLQSASVRTPAVVSKKFPPAGRSGRLPTRLPDWPVPRRPHAWALSLRRLCGWIRLCRSTWHASLCVFADDRDRLFERVHGGVGFVFGDDQRGCDSHRAWSAAEEKNAALEGQFDDAITFSSA